jgi:signal transduction histidine kinase
MRDAQDHSATTVAEAPSPFPASEPGPEPTLWRHVRRWLYGNTFRPAWLPVRWRHPLTGYAVMVALQVFATLVTLAMERLFPTFSFPEALIILVVALAALTWGAGPSIVATIAGTILLELAVLPHMPGGGLRRVGDVLEIVVVLAVGVIISVAASRTEAARRRAVKAYARSHAREVALRATNERTDEFLSLASHELRSPLTSIKMALQLAASRAERLAAQRSDDGAVPPSGDALDAVLGVLALAEHSVDRQDRLVGDLLDVSRIRAGRLEFHSAPCDVAAIASDAVEAQRLSWPGRTITLDMPAGALPAVADAYRIEQVVTNYLTNALKYSGEDAPVAVVLRREGLRARLGVRDRGPGLTREQQEHIWERFHRVPGIKQQSGSGAGLGLGLYICRTIVERHGGAVGVDSARGAGATFWCTLPLSPSAAEPTPPQAAVSPGHGERIPATIAGQATGGERRPS